MKRYVKSGKDVPRKVYIDTIDIGECIADEPDGAYVEVTDLYNGYGGQIIVKFVDGTKAYYDQSDEVYVQY